MRRNRHSPAVRRPSARRAAPFAIAALAVIVFTAIGPAGAQTVTTTTAPPATTVPTTIPPVTTTVAGGGTSTTAGTTATTAASTVTAVPATTTSSSDDDGLPWVPILVGVALLALLVVAVALLARRRGARRQGMADWRRRSAEVTAEAGATARLLSTGTPPSGQIAQQLVTSIAAFEDLSESAPDDETADAAERARRAVQMLGLAIDSDYRLRRGQPAPSAEQVAQSQDAVRNAAAEADRTLRGVYRSFTGQH